jgi:hypothetical protein
MSHWVKQELKSSRKVKFTCLCGFIFILFGTGCGAYLLFDPLNQDDEALSEDSNVSWN